MTKTLALATIAAATLLAACAGKDAGKPDSSKVAQAGAPAPAGASRGKFDPATHVATIYAKDYAFEAPDSVTAGFTTFHLVNEGQTLHHASLVRLDSGKTVADLAAAMKAPGPFPAWAVAVGGPNAPDPGASTDAAFDLKEGNYVVLCFVDMPEHVPHFAKGMVAPLKVVAATGAPAAAPSADVTVTLADYNFDVKGPLTAGKHTIKVVNNGPQEHEIEIAKLAPGKTAKDLVAWIAAPQGPPPGNAIGGISGTKSTDGYVTVDLAPGKYAFLCFIPDAKDGKAHVMHGMVKEIEVK